MIHNVKDRKFQQLNSELSYLKHFQEVSQSDLQAVKIWLGHFLEMFHVWQLRIKLFKFYNRSQWSSYLLHCESLFLGAINHCFGNKSHWSLTLYYIAENILTNQCEWSVCDLLPKQWFIAQWIPSVTMEKSWTPIDCHCKNFKILILSCHTWNIPKKCPSQIYKQWKSDLNNSWACFMYDNSELRCWIFYNGSQWVVMIFPLSQMGSIVQ